MPRRRKLTAYQLFCNDYNANNQVNQVNRLKLSIIQARLWRELSANRKSDYEERAKLR